MHPYFFGDSDKQLYGVYDLSRSSSFKDASVMLCYPVGQEYMRSHWAFRQLASQVCEAGLHCMRFDYYGTGDSMGVTSDADLSQWRTDVKTCFTEFKDISGISKMSLVGLRLGATIAATAYPGSNSIQKLVLWDPVVNGSDYIKGLRDMHKSLTHRLSRLHKVRKHKETPGEEEILGFSFSGKMIEDIEAVNLLETEAFSASEVCLFVSEQSEEYVQLRNHLQSLGILKEYRVFSTDGEWNNLNEIENALISNEIVSAISAEMCGD